MMAGNGKVVGAASRPINVVKLQADDALAKRGNAQIRERLRDENRLYDPALEDAWETRYKFFSGNHMKKAYRIFARARHDPFNKDPAWGQSVLHRVGTECSARGISLHELFKKGDVTDDGTLNRPEIKRIITGILPNLSDSELVSIFDSIDEDRSGEISIEEFIGKIKSASAGIAPEQRDVAEISKRWRNPVHKVRRYPPANVDGWDHLDAPPAFESQQKFADNQLEGVLGRLRDVISNSHYTKLNKYLPSHQYHSGGAESLERGQRGRRTPPAEPTPVVPSKGLAPRPGWFEESDMKSLGSAGGMRPPRKYSWSRR